jgi:hypothetical protein
MIVEMSATSVPATNGRLARRQSVDFKRLNLSGSDQALMRKWSRTVAAIYILAAVVGLVAAIATSGPRLDNVAAQRTPAVVTFDQN